MALAAGLSAFPSSLLTHGQSLRGRRRFTMMANSIRQSPGHPRMGRTRAMTLDDFRARFGRAVADLAKEMRREPSTYEVADKLAVSVRNLHRWCQRADGTTAARAIRQVSGGGGTRAEFAAR